MNSVIELFHRQCPQYPSGHFASLLLFNSISAHSIKGIYMEYLRNNTIQQKKITV